MTSRWKKLMCLALAFLCCLSLFPTAALAEEDNETDGGLIEPVDSENTGVIGEIPAYS